MIACLGLSWSGTNDSSFHLDYIYQVSNGRLPKPEGVEFNPAAGEPTGGRQFASAHPPLFYLLASIVAGDTLSYELWENAVLRVRLLNVLLGLSTVIATAWVARLSTRTNRLSFAVATAAIAPLMVSFTLFSGDIYNDVLLTLLSTLALGCTIKSLREGPSWPLVTVLSVISAAGMLTKATFVIPLAIAIGGVLIASFTTMPHQRPLVRSVVIGSKLVLLSAIPLLASAWFYARNLSLSGSWMRSSPKAPLLGREKKSLHDVLTNADFYQVYFEQFLGSKKISFLWTSNHSISLLVFLVAFVVLAYWAVRNAANWKSHMQVNWVFIRLAPVGFLLGGYAAQLSQATGYGQINIRYLFPALVFGGLVLGGAVSVLHRGSGAATTLTMLVLGAAAGNYLGWLATNRVIDVSLLDRLRSIGGQMVTNGLPLELFHLLGIVFVLGSVGVGIAVTMLQRTESTELQQEV